MTSHPSCRVTAAAISSERRLGARSHKSPGKRPLRRAALLATLIGGCLLSADRSSAPALPNTLQATLPPAPIAVVEPLIYRALADLTRPMNAAEARLSRNCLGARGSDKPHPIATYPEIFTARLAALGKNRFDGLRRYVVCLMTEQPGRLCTDAEARRRVLVHLDAYFLILNRRREAWSLSTRAPLSGNRNEVAVQVLKQMAWHEGQSLTARVTPPPTVHPALMAALRALDDAGVFHRERTNGTLPPRLRPVFNIKAGRIQSAPTHHCHAA